MLFYAREDPFAIWKADRLEYIILIQISTELTETRLQFLRVHLPLIILNPLQSFQI